MGVNVVFPTEEEEIIDQSEKVKEETAKRISEMGWLFDKVHSKLGSDSICFDCKRKIKSGEEVRIVDASESEKGTVIFVSLCSDCVKKYEIDERKEKGDKENGR